MLRLLGGLAWGHGGIPAGEGVLWDDEGQRTVVTSHGLLFEDGGWDWVCEEVVGYAFLTATAQTGAGWLLGSTDGVLHSEDGCDWQAIEALEGVLIGSLLTTPDGGVWAVTESGVWQGEGSDLEFVSLPDGAVLRSGVLTDDGGTLYVLGFLGATPTVWVGAVADSTLTWTGEATLPVDVGRLVALGVDPGGRGYGRFPAASGADQLLRFDAEGGVAVLRSTEAGISAFLATDTALYASVTGEGTLASLDDGATWSEPVGPPLTCLLLDGDVRIGCPADGSGAVWMTSDAAAVNPADWTWTEGLAFSDVAGPRCVDAATAEVCDPLWETVSVELGVSEGDTGSAEAVAPTGCTSAPGGWGWLAGMVSLLGLLRRRRTGRALT
ncbi:MAG: hypothetical protein ACI8RZ_000844 [Myxococcota bacterium]|jgi:hypothetical protein